MNPIVPVVVMDERESENVTPSDAVTAGADIASVNPIHRQQMSRR